ncbi:MAG: hypothetical protein CMM01_08990 [Rhodopirellula sp.]|nr:hypothetical protein [Rhodopirellula sp.]
MFQSSTAQELAPENSVVVTATQHVHRRSILPNPLAQPLLSIFIATINIQLTDFTRSTPASD